MLVLLLADALGSGILADALSGLWHTIASTVGAPVVPLVFTPDAIPPEVVNATPGMVPAAADAQDVAPANRVLLYGVFTAIIIALLTLDLMVFHRKAHAVKFREAITWTCVWITVAVLFTIPLYFMYQNHFFDLGTRVPVLGSAGEFEQVSGAKAVGQYFTGYVIELSLSMDNLFVMAVIFGSLRVPRENQHRVLFWGILGAIIMRGLMIIIGVALIAKFSWIIYVFGGLLIFTAIKMAFTKEDGDNESIGPLRRLMGKLLPLTDKFDGQKFFIRIDGKKFATPLFVALITIEFTDLIFAVDSIPAIFAITADPFIVFTSNITAILGLRSLYSCLSSMLNTFRFLKPALIVVLLFIGIKMCLIHTPIKIPNEAALGIVLGILATGVLASLLAPHSKQPDESPTAPELPGHQPSKSEDKQGWDA